ncbi:MAG: hypothetical protein Unbinned5350contig1001_56 [Prokaryotic dsDNA virus sp.]|nr:MAG: hypothetical protein Unbinned5350contig1001_56 [Prokaryotic dsDNA virus sp.]|tara:strand:- start:320 stop:961 length:642 start_codon:yes stop_codon:yes gene_type:complete
MIVRNPLLPVISEPRLIDLALVEIQARISTKLAWVNNAFGKAEKKGDSIKYPAVFVGGAKDEGYLKLFPDSNLGNYCFFDFEDGEEINNFGRRSAEMERKFGLVFCFDFTKVYPTFNKNRTVENVKNEVLQVLGKTGFKGSTFRINEFHEEKQNVFKGYTISEISKTANMRPYGFFRLSGEISYSQAGKCDLDSLQKALGINYMQIENDFEVS